MASAMSEAACECRGEFRGDAQGDAKGDASRLLGALLQQDGGTGAASVPSSLLHNLGLSHIDTTTWKARGLCAERQHIASITTPVAQQGMSSTAYICSALSARAGSWRAGSVPTRQLDLLEACRTCNTCCRRCRSASLPAV